MVDRVSKETRSIIMSHIRSKDTKPEIIVRQLLFSKGFRYRLHRNDLPGTPDIYLPKYKTAIFVHGCFWHGHKCRIGSGNRIPATNTEFWSKKIIKNVNRFERDQDKLLSMGYFIIILWECEIYDGSFQGKLDTLFEAKKNNTSINGFNI